MLRKLVISALLSLALALPANADFNVATWNLESGDSQVEYLAKEIQKWAGIGLWGFSEVQNEQMLVAMSKSLNQANVAAKFAAILGTTGGADRLAIAFDQNKFQILHSWEIEEVNVGRTLRAPLVGHLQELATGKEFLFVVNHFYRGRSNDEKRRQEQAIRLREWGKKQTLPIVSVGDFNFDCKLPELEICNPAYGEMVADDVFAWLFPKNPMKTQCSQRYNSILDFVFVTGEAKSWAKESWILNVREEACMDNKYKSDHRPVMAVFATR